MKKEKNNSKNRLTINLPELSHEDFDKFVNADIRGLLGIFPTSDNCFTDYSAETNHPPKKQDNESFEEYFHRLKELCGQTIKVKDTHERWKEKHVRAGGIFERDFKQRIKDQLRSLLQSGFLRKEYIDTDMPREDCDAAREMMTKEGWSELLVMEGADWKLALMIRHLIKAPERRLLCDEDNVGYYIHDMRNLLTLDDVDAFFRFDAFMHFVYADLEELEDDEDYENEDECEKGDSKTEEDECPKIFDKKLNDLQIKDKLKDLDSDDVKGKRRWYVFYRVLKYLEWTKATQKDFIVWVAHHFEWNGEKEFRGVPSEFTHTDPPEWGNLVIKTKGSGAVHENPKLGPAYYAFAVKVRDTFVTVDDDGKMHDKDDFLAGKQKLSIKHHNIWK
jgi:hypothetical protein